MKHTNRLVGRTGAFTLIEILVIIAIISLLTAILFPVFGRARENARRTSCLSNMKQIGLGVMQYTQDFDETFPVGSSAGADRGNGWAGQIFPYIKSSQAFTCPSDASLTGADLGQNSLISYAMNQSIVWSALSCTATALISGFSAPTFSVMFFEVSGCQWFARDDAPKPGYTWISSPTGNGGANYPNLISPQSNAAKVAYATGYFNGIGSSATPFDKEPRHMGGANYIFADGHVKWLRSVQVSPGLAAPTAKSAAQPFGGCYAAAGTDTLGGLAATFSPR